MPDPERSFHWRDGIFFERRTDGSVRLRCCHIDKVIPAAEWASIIATMSLPGETSEAYQKAREFHGA